jgi:hypothetical protein
MTSQTHNFGSEIDTSRLIGAAMRIDPEQMGRNDAALQKTGGSLASLAISRGEDVSKLSRELVWFGVIGSDDPRAVAAQEMWDKPVDISPEGRVAYLGESDERITDILKHDVERNTRVKLMAARSAIRSGDFQPASAAHLFEDLAQRAHEQKDPDLALKAAGGFVQATKVAIALQKEAPERQKDTGRDR